MGRKTPHFKQVSASKYPFHITSIVRKCSRFHDVQGISFYLTHTLG